MALEGVLAVRIDHLLDALVVGRNHDVGSVHACEIKKFRNCNFWFNLLFVDFSFK